MGYFSRTLFRKLWDAVGKKIGSAMKKVASNPSLIENVEVLKKVESGLRLNVLDVDGSGTVSVDEIHDALRDLLGLSVHDENKTLAEYVHAHADVTGNGIVTREDFEHFCTVLPGGLASTIVMQLSLNNRAQRSQSEMITATTMMTKSSCSSYPRPI